MIGRKLKELRLAAGYKSLRQLAIASGVDLSILSRIENNKHDSISPGTLNKLAKCLNMSKDLLLEFSGMPEVREHRARYKRSKNIYIPVLRSFERNKALAQQTDITELLPISEGYTDNNHFAIKITTHNSGGFISKDGIAIVHCTVEYDSGQLLACVKNSSFQIRKAVKIDGKIVLLDAQGALEITDTENLCIAGVVVAKFEKL